MTPPSDDERSSLPVDRAATTGPEGTLPAQPAGDAEVIGVRQGMFGVRGSGDTSGYGRLVRPVTLPDRKSVV